MIVVRLKQLGELDISLQLMLKKKNPDINPYQKIFSQMYQYTARTVIDALSLFFRLNSDNHTSKEKLSVSVSEILKILCVGAKKILAVKTDANLYTSSLEKELKESVFGHDN